MMKRDYLEKVQLRNLKAIIKHAYDTVPYYSQLFRSVRIKPEDIKNMSDLRKLPLTNRDDVKKNYSKMVSKKSETSRLHVSSTTGSTGKPLKVYYDNATEGQMIATWRYALLECGLGFSDPFVQIHAFANGSYVKPRFSPFFLMNKGEMSLYSKMSKIVENLARIKPVAIYSFPSFLLLLADFIRENGSRGIQPRMVFSNGEILSKFQRRQIQKNMRVDINDMYGCAEFGRLAFECNEHIGLHIIPDCILEILDAGEPIDAGEDGEIVVTGLYNYAMPLIRYKLDDVGVMTNEYCNCGRSLPLIKDVLGRVDDFLVLPSGTVISPRNINLMEGIDGIAEYQTIQQERDLISVKIVKEENFSQCSVEKVKKVILDGCLGEKVRVEVQIVENIPKERTGKKRTIISKVCQR
jgi:phenylacetate-CoA ligase